MSLNWFATSTTQKAVNVASSPASKKDILADSTDGLLYCCILELRPVPVCDPLPSIAAMPFKGTVREL